MGALKKNEQFEKSEKERLQESLRLRAELLSGKSTPELKELSSEPIKFENQEEHFSILIHDLNQQE